MTALAQIRLDNPSLMARDEPSFFCCTVPLRQGAVQPADQLRLDNGDPCEIRPFGALWPDGSVRTALVRGWTTIGAASRKMVGVEIGAPPTYGALAIENADTAARRPQVGYNIPLGVNQPSAFKETATNAGLRSIARGRFVDGEMWYQLEIEVAPSGSHLYWWLTVGWSNPRNPASNWTMPYPLELAAPAGTVISCYWPNQKGVSNYIRPEGGNTLTLLPNGTVWGDGQAHCWRGAMVLTATPTQSALAALQKPILAIATAESWRSSLAWGPFADAPSRPSWMPSDQAVTDWVIRQVAGRDLAPRDAWHESRYGLRFVPGSTGDQMDFGVMNAMAAVMTGEPLAIDLYLEDALQDSCRPTHFCEADGSIVKAASHPMLVMWDQRPHFNTGVSPDRLGKATVGSFESHQWWGRDNQHWSFNLQASAYYLTGDPQLGLLIDHECETFLSQQNLPIPPLRPGWPTTGPDASRAVGRTLLAGSWLYLCTGRQDMRKRLTDRVDLSIRPNWSGASLSAPLARPFMLMQTDGRQAPIPVGSQAWFPWQEGIAVTGLEACYRVTGHQPARDLAVELARTLSRYGWQWRSGSADAQIANCIVWNNGQDTDRNDLLKFQPADGTDFALWVQPSTILDASVYRPGNPDASALARIVGSRYAGRPSDGGPGRYAQWASVTDVLPT